MKKIIYLFILLLVFIPYVVRAEECNNDIVTVESITMLDKDDSVIVKEEPTIDGMTINLNNSIAEVGDSIEYNIVVKNESEVDYYLKKSDFNISSKYIDYKYEPEDGTNVIEAGASKTIKLTVTYKKEVPNSVYKAGSYKDDKLVILNLANSDSINVSNTLKNISIVTVIAILVIMVLIVFGIISIKNKKYSNMMLIILGMFMFIIPTYVNAMCSGQIVLASNLEIKKNYKPCTFEGNLVQGAEYVEGQYTYHYKEKFDMTYNYSSSSFVPSWKTVNEDGWGVTLTDHESTTPVTSKLCTSINGKPIIYTTHMLHNSKATSIDTSSYDTSNVISMEYMFSGIEVATLDVSMLNTSNVIDMSDMFGSMKNVTSIDLSNFNTSKVKYFTSMFYNSEKLENIDVTKLDTTGAINMHMMFALTKIEGIDLSNFRTPNVTDISNLFYGCNSLKKIDLSSFDTSKVTSFGPLFEGCFNLEEIIIDNWVFNVQPGSLFFGPHSSKKVSMNNVTLNFDNYNQLLGKMELEPTVETVEVAKWHFKEGRTSLASIFKPYSDYGSGIKNLVGLDTWDVSNITGFGEMFSGLTHIETLKLDNWKVKVVPGGLFVGLTGLKNLSLKKWKLPEVFRDAIFRQMVGGESIETIDVTNWDLSSTTDISGVFGFNGTQGTRLREIKGLNTWNTSTITNMSGAFMGLTSMTSFDFSSFDTSNVTNMGSMFYRDTGLVTLDLSTFDFSSIQTAGGMLSSCTNLTTVYAKDEASATVIRNSGDVPTSTTVVVKES